MYDNIPGSGWLSMGYLDSDPVRQDPVYLKLGKMLPRHNSDIKSGSQKVAWHYQNDVWARQMNERRYNHIRRTPLSLLKLEFAVRHETDEKLRIAIDNRERYMFRSEEKEWY